MITKQHIPGCFTVNNERKESRNLPERIRRRAVFSSRQQGLRQTGENTVSRIRFHKRY